MNNIIRENMLRFGTKNLTESQLKNIQETKLNEASIVWDTETNALNNMVTKLNAALDARDANNVAKGFKPKFTDYRYAVKETKKTIDFRSGAQIPVPVWIITFGGAPLMDIGLSAEYLFVDRGGNKSNSFKSLWLQPFRYSRDKINAIAKKLRISNQIVASAITAVSSSRVNIPLDSYNDWLAQREGAGDVQSPEN